MSNPKDQTIELQIIIFLIYLLAVLISLLFPKFIILFPIIFSIFILLLILSVLFLLSSPILIIYFSTLFLPSIFYKLLALSMLTVACRVLWVLGERRERRSENPLKNILEPKKINFAPTRRLKKVSRYKKKRQNNHKMRN